MTLSLRERARLELAAKLDRLAGEPQADEAACREWILYARTALRDAAAALRAALDEEAAPMGPDVLRAACSAHGHTWRKGCDGCEAAGRAIVVHASKAPAPAPSAPTAPAQAAEPDPEAATAGGFVPRDWSLELPACTYSALAASRLPPLTVNDGTDHLVTVEPPPRAPVPVRVGAASAPTAPAPGDGFASYESAYAESIRILKDALDGLPEYDADLPMPRIANQAAAAIRRLRAAPSAPTADTHPCAVCGEPIPVGPGAMHLNCYVASAPSSPPSALPTGRAGPEITVGRSCSDCVHVEEEPYVAQGDSGFRVSCALASRTIGDTTWRTPEWCPVLAAPPSAPNGKGDRDA